MSLVDGAIENDSAREEALATLHDVSLVKQDPFEDGTPAWTVHRLAQAVARARQRATPLEQWSRQRIISRLLAIYPDDGFGNSGSWPLCAQLTPHVLTLRHSIETRSSSPDFGEVSATGGKLFPLAGCLSRCRPFFARGSRGTLDRSDRKIAKALI
jgi:hypothetical protein